MNMRTKKEIRTTIKRRKWLIENRNNLPELKAIAAMFNVSVDAIRKDLQQLNKYEKSYNILSKLSKTKIKLILQDYKNCVNIDEIIINHNLDYGAWQIITNKFISKKIKAIRIEKDRLTRESKQCKDNYIECNWDFSGENYNIPPAKYRMSAITNNTGRAGCAAEMVVDCA